MGPVEISQRTIGGVTILALAGEFDAFHLPVASGAIEQLIHRGSTRLVLNLREMRFITSAPLGYLLETAHLVKELGGELVISDPSEHFRNTTKTLGIDQIFRIFPNEDEAVSSLLRDSTDSS